MQDISLNSHLASFSLNRSFGPVPQRGNLIVGRCPGDRALEMLIENVARSQFEHTPLIVRWRGTFGKLSKDYPAF